MREEYLDRLAALMPADVVDRYVAVKDAMSACHLELRDLEQELIEIGRRYGVPDIDVPKSATNENIRTTLGAKDLEINSIWVAAPADWCCPCCKRTKPACARVGTKGQLLGKLVAHHDHIEELMQVVLSDLSKTTMIEATSADEAYRFIRRGTELFSRFDRIILCEDCNNAEANGKTTVGADRHFTFTPREIASFICASSNQPHEIDQAALSKTYATALPHFEWRVVSLRRLAEQALKGSAWYEVVDREDLDEQIERRAQQALTMFGLEHVGYGTVREMFFEDRKIDAKHAPAWRTKPTAASRLPAESELAFVIRGNGQYESLPEDWACPCCARHKLATVRWSLNAKKFIFVIKTRNIADTSTHSGKCKVTLCDACNYVFAECSKELRTVLGAQVVPECPVGIEDIRTIIRLRPYSLHEIDGAAAQALIDTIVSALSIE